MEGFVGRRWGKKLNSPVPLKGQSNFRPLNEGQGSYTAFRHPNRLKDLNRAMDHLQKNTCLQRCARRFRGSWPLQARFKALLALTAGKSLRPISRDMAEVPALCQAGFAFRTAQTLKDLWSGNSKRKRSERK